MRLDQAGKQAAELESRLQAVEREREASIKQAAELKGQVEMLQVQNSELIARLAALAAGGRPVNS